MSSQNRNLKYSVRTTNELIHDYIEDYVLDYIKTSIPAVVTNVLDYETKQVVDVKTVITSTYDDGTVTKQLNLQKIFVKLQEGNGFKIKLPIKVGDKVTLHYTHRALNSWLSGSGESVSEDIEMSFGNKDCYVLHGFGTVNNHQSPSKTDMIIEGHGITITLKPDGSITTVATKTDLTSPNNFIKGDINITGDIEQTGDTSITGNLEVSTQITTPTINVSGNTLDSNGFSVGDIKYDTIESEGQVGVSGVFPPGSGFTVTNGIITGTSEPIPAETEEV